ncbi:MAG: hypothetical protein M3N13_05450, partial [Candidatus Eremiobacteraeota bacterium]|nr:hypothetical protein [Candidatus Eremiobacteraeota bacterium]
GRTHSAVLKYIPPSEQSQQKITALMLTTETSAIGESEFPAMKQYAPEQGRGSPSLSLPVRLRPGCASGNSL